jgi:hypothetical protein
MDDVGFELKFYKIGIIIKVSKTLYRKHQLKHACQKQFARPYIDKFKPRQKHKKNRLKPRNMSLLIARILKPICA